MDRHDELLTCPSCEFSKEKHREWHKNMRHVTPDQEESWEGMKPIVYHCRLINDWMIECQNCGMTVSFNQSAKQENIALWNDLSYRATGD